MRSRGVLFLLLILGASAVAVFVHEPPAVRAQPEGAAPPGAQVSEYLGTRYRVLIIQSSGGPGYAGGYPSLNDFAVSTEGAVKPLGRRPAAEGYFATVPTPIDLIDAIKKRGGNPEIIYVGEAETTPGRECAIETGTRFPVKSVQQRGESQTVTTQFEKVGMKVKVDPSLNRTGGDGIDPPGVSHQVAMEFSARSAFTEGGIPVITEFSSVGNIILPDAHMAMFGFLDRVPAETLALAMGEGGGEVAGDKVTLYFVCIIRMDMGR